MGTRRGNGEGSIFARKDGRFEGSVRYTDPITGKPRRVSVYGPSKAAVREKLKQTRARLEAGAPPKDATCTVGDWLARWRTTTLAASDRKESTRELYATLCRVYLEVAPFADIRLDRLRPSDIDALILAMRTKTKSAPAGDDVELSPAAPVRALSDSTIRSTYTVLRTALDGAVRDGLIATNPATLVRRPTVERTEARHLSAREVAAVLDAAKASRYYTALVLIASTGLRRGEALALSWGNVDLDAGVCKVAATIGRVGGQLKITAPKTARSRREIPLHPSVVTMLRAHRTEQKQERMRAANKWVNVGLVFTTELGAPVDPRNLLRVIESAARAAKVEGIGTHTLRHSAAVAWLEAGTHIKQVADLLGHSSIAVTGDIYGHSSEAGARAAVDALGAGLGL